MSSEMLTLLSHSLADSRQSTVGEIVFISEQLDGNPDVAWRSGHVCGLIWWVNV